MSRAPGRFWSNVLAVAYKEASIIRHDRALVGTVVAQPVMMLLLFGLALSNKPANVPWAVLDRSDTALSRRLVQEIQATGYFLPPQRASGYEHGRELLRRGEAMALVVIPHDLRRQLERGQPRIQLLLDGSDPLSAARVGGYIAQVAAAVEVLPAAAAGPRAGELDLRQRFWFNPTLSDREFFLVALAGMLLTNLCLSATALGLVGERESGTYEQMLALPTTPLEIVLGKLVPFVVISYGVLLFAIAGAGLGFGLWPQGNWLTLLVVTLPFVLASLAVGVLVSTLAHTSAQAVFITVFFIMPSFVLSGTMIPYQLMPSGIRELGGLFPLRWYQIILRRIGARGAGFSEVALPVLALLILFAVLLATIRRRMKPRLS
ncbi:MAG: ABC transporter permease [Deltaproteobacteria bacterium]|nr:ABC transporter permease [Deltaproteobacteria bacterium]